MSVHRDGVERMTRVLLWLGVDPVKVRYDGMEIISSTSGGMTEVELRMKLAPDVARRVLEVMNDAGPNG